VIPAHLDKRDSSWAGHKGHEALRPYDPNATRALNQQLKDNVQKELDKR
jgi:reverse gyrase